MQQFTAYICLSISGVINNDFDDITCCCAIDFMICIGLTI